jgi:hypothetical protein
MHEQLFAGWPSECVTGREEANILSPHPRIMDVVGTQNRGMHQPEGQMIANNSRGEMEWTHIHI